MFAVIKFICVHFFYFLQRLAFRAERKFSECEGRVKPGLTYPELLFSLNEEKMILEESLHTSCLLKMSRSILDCKYGGYLILRFCSDIDF